jgi:hypothetical protein
MRWAGQRALVASVGIIAAACAHVSSRSESSQDGLAAVKAWTGALYAGDAVSFADRTWWIGDATRKLLAQRLLPACSPPPPDSRSVRNMAPELQTELCQCMAGKFVPMILRETHDARWDDLIRALPGAARFGLHGLVLGSSRSWVVNEYGMGESVFERLRGASRERPPAIEEIAMRLLLTADAMAQHLADMGTVDPGITLTSLMCSSQMSP